jgi:hypothetical protein
MTRPGIYTELPFSYNWNSKLSCDYLTTIRLLNYGKYNPGQRLEVTLKGIYQFDVEVIKHRAVMLKDITDVMAYLDTGYDAKQTQSIIERMYPKANWDMQLLSYALLHRIKS